MAKVVDFGLVKDLQAEESVELTAANTIAGTPLFLSPEAIRGAAGVGPGACTDVGEWTQPRASACWREHGSADGEAAASDANRTTAVRVSMQERGIR